MNLSIKKLLAVTSCLFIYGAGLFTEYAEAGNCEPELFMSGVSYSFAMSKLKNSSICSVLKQYVTDYNYRDNFCIEIQDPDISEPFFVEIDVSCNIIDDGKRNETFTIDQGAEDSESQPAGDYQQMETLSDIQFIMENENFTLQRIYFDGFEGAIRNCIFESESALWTIRYCGELKVEGPWYRVMAGDFSIKNTDLKLQYYLGQRGRGSVYRKIEDGLFNFKYANRINLVDRNDRINVSLSIDHLPFLKTLARVQEQYIDDSFIHENTTQNSCAMEVSNKQCKHSEPKINQVYPQSKMRADLFDIQFIMNNEDFALKEVYFTGDENSVRNCVFESESVLWTISYCHFGEKGDHWYLFLAGNFVIKESGVQLDYYLERESNIYRNIEHGSLAFAKQSFPELRYGSLAAFAKQSFPKLRVDLIDGDMKVNLGWSANRLSFLQTLARIQEQYIEQSVAVAGPVEEN